MSNLSNVKGLDLLQKELNNLPAKMEKNVMRGALRAGANAVRNQAKLNAPVGKPSGEGSRIYKGHAGALRDSIRVTTKAKGFGVTASVVAGGKNKKTGADTFYAHMVEYGTAPHIIKAKSGRKLSFGGGFASSISHPGAAPRPFMRPALDSKHKAAVLAVGNYIKKRLSTKHGINTAHINLEGDE